MTQSVILSSHIFGTNAVRVFGTVEEPWFAGVDVAICLGYSTGDNANCRKAIRVHVSEDNQKSTEVQNGPGLKLINEFGLYELILKSKKDEAKVFQKWVTSEVLPSIRKTGKYELKKDNSDEVKENVRKIRMETCLLVAKYFQEYGDERDIMAVNDQLRTLTFNSTPQITAGETENENTECSLSRRLSEKYKLTGKKYDQMLIPFGKDVKVRYIQIRGKEPPKRLQWVNGTNRHVCSYTIADFTEFIDRMFRIRFQIELV